MNQKNTTKKTAKKTAAKPIAASVIKTIDSVKPGVVKASEKPAAPVKTYATFGALLAAKSKKALPYGTKAQVGVDRIIFAAKGVCIANLPITDFVTNELKRHAFSVGNVG